MWSAPNADDEFAHVASLWAVPTTFDDDDDNNGPSASGPTGSTTAAAAPTSSFGSATGTPTSAPAVATTPLGNFTVTEGFATPSRGHHTPPPPPPHNANTNAATGAIVSPSNGGRAKLCKFHANGGCAKGADCPFSHDLSIRASTSAAAKAGFVFVTGVANIIGAQNIESPEGSNEEPGCSTPTGLNPAARAFAPGSDSDAENNGYTGRHHYGGEDVEAPPSQSYFGAADHLLHQQHADYDSAGAGGNPYRSGYASNAATPPTYTQRRRVPFSATTATAEVPLDFASRQHQALRPPLEISHSGVNKIGVSPKPTERRPRPPPTGAGAHHSHGYGNQQHHGRDDQGHGDHLSAGYAHGDESAADSGYYYHNGGGGGGGVEGYHSGSQQHQQQQERFVPWQGFH